MPQIDWGIVGTIASLLMGGVVGIGYIVGSYKRAKSDGARHTFEESAQSLDVALKEIALYKAQADRLEQEVSELRTETRDLRAKIDGLTAERDLYKSMVMLSVVPEPLTRKFDELMAAIRDTR